MLVDASSRAEVMKAVHLRIAVLLAIGVVAPPVAFADEDRTLGMGTPIATLEVGEHFVVVAVTVSGVRYSVTTRDRRWLGANLSADELEANFPAVFERIHSSIARSTVPGEFIWAGQ